MWKLLNHKNEIYIVFKFDAADESIQNDTGVITNPMNTTRNPTYLGNCSRNTVTTICINRHNIDNMQRLNVKCIVMPDIRGYQSIAVPLLGRNSKNPDNYNIIDSINELLTLGYVTLTDMQT